MTVRHSSNSQIVIPNKCGEREDSGIEIPPTSNVAACPFASTMNIGQCPAFVGRCPFSNAGANGSVKEDVNTILAMQTPASHFAAITEESPEEDKNLKAIEAVRLLRESLNKTDNRPKYCTKTSTSDMLLDKMESLSSARDVRLWTTSTPKLGFDGKAINIKFPIDVIDRKVSEADCIEYVVSLYRIFTALEKTWTLTGEGRVRSLHSTELARSALMQSELSVYFKVDPSELEELLNTKYPQSSVVKDCIKRINHLLIVNPLLLVSYMYVMYAGTMYSRDFRRGLRYCAPSIARAAVFRDLDNCWGRASQYCKMVDSAGFTFEEADEIILELKYVFKMQINLFTEIDKKNCKDEIPPVPSAETRRIPIEETTDEQTDAQLATEIIDILERDLTQPELRSAIRHSYERSDVQARFQASQPFGMSLVPRRVVQSISRCYLTYHRHRFGYKGQCSYRDIIIVLITVIVLFLSWSYAIYRAENFVRRGITGGYYWV